MRSYDNNDGSGAPFGTGVFQHEPIRSSGQSDRPIPIMVFVLILVLTFALGIAVTLLLTRPDPVTATKPEPKMPTLEALIAASLEPKAVTRGAPLDLLSQPHPIAEVLTGLQPVGQPVTQPAEPTVPAAQALAAATALATDQLEKDAERALGLHMRMLREGVLAGVYTVETREKNGNRQLLLRPINVELSRRFMKTLLRAAEERGQITFPKGLSTENGEVDLDTMLFNLVQNSLANDGTLEGAAAAREMTRRAFAAAGVQAATKTKGDQTYVVEPGDSLAYISLKFYGAPGAYTRIFQANRNILTSPEQIKVGQRLVIPG